MKEILQKYLTVLRKDRHHRKKVTGILCMLSLVVMLAVAWQLRFVGIAKADEPSCGKEEHVHTEKCIERRLICGLKEGDPEPDTPLQNQDTGKGSESVHHHGEECFEELKTLKCQKAEHTHGDKCYEIRKFLDCDQEEHVHADTCYEIRDVLVCTEDHEHTADCWKQEKVLVCGKKEHTHSDDCYRVEKVLICQQEEHTHGPECYDVEDKLICGMEEGQVIPNEEFNNPTVETNAPGAETEPDKRKGHVHTDACYEEVYICGKEEHKHTLDCYANPDADVETYQDWEKTLPEEMGRTWGENVLKVAQSQMGYKESTRNFKTAEDGQTKMGYTRYGEWYGNRYGEWNTIFTSFCLRYAGVPVEAVPRHAGAFAMSVKVIDLGLYEEADYVPQPGDIVFLQDEDQKNINRTAIVASLGFMIVDDVKVPSMTVIEGNRNGAVAPNKYERDDEIIQGYVSMAAASARAQELGIPSEPIPERTPETETQETEGTTETTAAAETTETTAPTQETEDVRTPEQLDTELSVLLKEFAAEAENFNAAQEKADKENARAAKFAMESIFDKIQNVYALRYPDSGEADFVAYLNNNAEQAYKTYGIASEAYKKEEGSTGPTEPKVEAVNAETVRLLDSLSGKASEFEKAAGEENAELIRSLGEDMNLLYNQAEVLYNNQFGQEGDKSFEDYLKETYPKAVEMLEECEKRLNIRSLNAMLQAKLQTFDEKAEACAKAMNVDDAKTAQNLKLDLDTIYLELKDLHAKRYPGAEEGSFDIFLNNNHSKAVKRYLAAVKAYPEVQLDNYISYTDPVTGEIRRIFRMLDGMELDVSLTGSICFPVEENAEEMNAIDTTANLETVSKDGAVLNTTQEAAEGQKTFTGSVDTSATGMQISREEAEAANEKTSEKPADTDQKETEKTDSRWNNIQVDVLPVSQEAEQAFAKYVTENHPDAEGITMLNVKYQYHGIDLDLGDAKATIIMTPTDETPAKPETEKPAGPVVKNAPVLESMSPAEAGFRFSVDNPAMGTVAPAARHREVVVLEYRTDGTVAPVAQGQIPGGAPEKTKISVDAKQNAVYASVETYTLAPHDHKPVDPDKVYNGVLYDNAQAYPDYWVSSVMSDDTLTLDQAVVKQIDGSPADFKPDDPFDPKTDKSLVLRNDPYFTIRANEEKAVEGVFGFEYPEATLGFVLRNYNLFTFENAYCNHVVGSVAVQGDAYYHQPQGGTGSGEDAYVPIPNYAPTYIKGSLLKIPTYMIPDQIPAHENVPVQINVNAPDRNGQKSTLFPTYLGLKNQKNTNFAIANRFTGPLDACTLPVYYSNDYIRFTDFKNQMDHILSTTLKGIPVHDDGNQDFSKRYAWKPGNQDNPTRLFLRMGHSYILDEDILTGTKDRPGVQLILVPPDNYDFTKYTYPGAAFPDTTDRKANHLAMRDIETSIICNGDSIRIPSDFSSEGKTKNGVEFYTGNGFDKNPHNVGTITYEQLKDGFYTNASLKGAMTKDSTCSITYIFPKATSVVFGSRAGHIIAPNAVLDIPNTGDGYGSNICKTIRAPGDLHMLPYIGKKPGIKNEAFPYEILKQVSEETDGKTTVRNPAPGESFTFKMDLVPALCENVEIAKRTEGPMLHFVGSNTVADIAFKDTVVRDKETVVRDLLNADKTLNADQADLKLTDTSKEGKIVYRVTEDKVGGFEENTEVYELTFRVVSRSEQINPDDMNSGTKDTFYVVGCTAQKVDAAGTKTDITDTKLVFTNKAIEAYEGPELPHTGGIGVLPFAVTGLAFTLIPVYLVLDARKKERRVK